MGANSMIKKLLTFVLLSYCLYFGTEAFGAITLVDSCNIESLNGSVQLAEKINDSTIVVTYTTASPNTFHMKTIRIGSDGIVEHAALDSMSKAAGSSGQPHTGQKFGLARRSGTNYWGVIYRDVDEDMWIASISITDAGIIGSTAWIDSTEILTYEGRSPYLIAIDGTDYFMGTSSGGIVSSKNFYSFSVSSSDGSVTEIETIEQYDAGFQPQYIEYLSGGYFYIPYYVTAGPGVGALSAQVEKYYVDPSDGDVNPVPVDTIEISSNFNPYQYIGAKHYRGSEYWLAGMTTNTRNRYKFVSFDGDTTSGNFGSPIDSIQVASPSYGGYPSFAQHWDNDSVMLWVTVDNIAYDDYKLRQIHIDLADGDPITQRDSLTINNLSVSSKLLYLTNGKYVQVAEQRGDNYTRAYVIDVPSGSGPSPPSGPATNPFGITDALKIYEVKLEDLNSVYDVE
jgi:hypothetical protein